MGTSIVLAVIVVFIMIFSYVLIKIRRRNVQKRKEAEHTPHQGTTTNSNW